LDVKWAPYFAGIIDIFFLLITLDNLSYVRLDNVYIIARIFFIIFLTMIPRVATFISLLFHTQNKLKHLSNYYLVRVKTIIVLLVYRALILVLVYFNI